MIVAISAAYRDGTSGHVRIFKFDNVTWTWDQLNDIDGEAFGEYSGWSVATVAIGAPSLEGDSPRSGYVQIFDFDDVSRTWDQLGVTDGE
jgi:hypothetical protein